MQHNPSEQSIILRLNPFLLHGIPENFHGVRGTIAELAHVDEKYKLSLEIAAGPRMQAVVVEDDAAAAEAIGYLQKKKLGRATFLPINKMIVGKPRAQALMTVKDESSLGICHRPGEL